MRDVDALSRRYGTLVAHYMVYAAKLTAADHIHRPVAYDPSAFPVHTTKCPTTTVPVPSAPSATVASSNHTSIDQRFVLHHTSFTSCPAFLEPAASIVPRPPARGSHLAHPIRSFSTSTPRVDSGLNAQPLSNVCPTWLSVDPGIPSLAMTLPTLNPLLCITPIILVPAAASIPFAKRLLPRSVPVFAINLAQLSSRLRSHLQVSTSLCHLLHQRQTPSHVPYQPMASADPNLDVTPPLPPINGANFTVPASPSAHSACAALPWLLRVLDVIQLLIRTNPLRVFLISIACSRTDDDVSDLAAATSAFCSTAGCTLVCCTINTAAIGDLVSSIRWIAIAHCSNTAACLNPLLSPVHDDPLCAGYGSLVISTRNCRDESILALRRADVICDTSISSASPLPDQPLTTSPRPLAPVVTSLRPLARSAMRCPALFSRHATCGFASPACHATCGFASPACTLRTRGTPASPAARSANSCSASLVRTVCSPAYYCPPSMQTSENTSTLVCS
jgi:hypothetical protein